MRGHFTKYRRVCTAHSRQRWTHLYRTSPKFDANSNSSAMLVNSKCSVMYANVDTIPNFCDQAGFLIKRMYIKVMSDLPDGHTNLDQPEIMHRWTRTKEEDQFVTTALVASPKKCVGARWLDKQSQRSQDLQRLWNRYQLVNHCQQEGTVFRELSTHFGPLVKSQICGTRI